MEDELALISLRKVNRGLLVREFTQPQYKLAPLKIEVLNL